MAVPRMSSTKRRWRSPGLQQPDVGAEALDGADAGEGGDERLAHAAADQVAGLGDVGEVRRARSRGATSMTSVPNARRGACLPRLDGRHPVAGAGRHVGAVVVEAAVAAARRRR